MGQTMDHSSSSHSEQKIPQSKPPAGRTQKKAKASDEASPRPANINVDSRSSMAKLTSKFSREERQRMIEEAAYYRAEQRGFYGEQKLQDWLDAESEINSKFPG